MKIDAVSRDSTRVYSLTSHDGPIGRRKRGYILTMDQSMRSVEFRREPRKNASITTRDTSVRAVETIRE
eukprot:1176088-Prorocentrum_minimum.AAC.1